MLCVIINGNHLIASDNFDARYCTLHMHFLISPLLFSSIESHNQMFPHLHGLEGDIEGGDKDLFNLIKIWSSHSTSKLTNGTLGYHFLLCTTLHVCVCVCVLCCPCLARQLMYYPNIKTKYILKAYPHMRECNVKSMKWPYISSSTVVDVNTRRPVWLRRKVRTSSPS